MPTGFSIITGFIFLFTIVINQFFILTIHVLHGDLLFVIINPPQQVLTLQRYAFVYCQ